MNNRPRYHPAKCPRSVADTIGHLYFLGKGIEADFVMFISFIVKRGQVGQHGYILANNRRAVVIFREYFSLGHSEGHSVYSVFSALRLKGY